MGHILDGLLVPFGPTKIAIKVPGGGVGTKIAMNQSSVDN